MTHVAFTGRVLIIGCGSVAQCVLPVLLAEIDLSPSQVTVFDFVDNQARIADQIRAGVGFVHGRITEDNLDSTLSELCGPGDICLDLAWNIDCNTILQWCRDHGVRYLNTSVEVWDPYEDAANIHPLDRTLYRRHMELRRLIAGWPDNRGASAVVEHGANPGLVSHWTKQAMRDLATRGLTEGVIESGSVRALESALAAREYNQVARLLDVKVIHIAERDTQVTDRPKGENEFVNTWSVDGLYEEGVAPAELGWGTHERRMPVGAFQHSGEGPGNQLALAQMGCKTWVRSRVPSGEIVGMIIRHGEAFTITDRFTVWDGPTPVYRPTVHYAYCPSDSAIASLHELEMRQYVMQDHQRILNDEILPGGRDELGVLLMGHPFKSWWTGSLLTIDDARALVPHQNATTLQVAASILGAVVWMIRNPNEGVRVPDELPWEEVLGVAKPYLGELWSGPLDWDPLSTRFDVFSRYAHRDRDQSDPWQFANFLV